MELVYGPIQVGLYYERVYRRVYRREDGVYFISSQDTRYSAQEHLIAGGTGEGPGAEILDEEPISPVQLAEGLRRNHATFEDYKRVFRPESLAVFYYHFGPTVPVRGHLEMKPLYTLAALNNITFNVNVTWEE